MSKYDPSKEYGRSGLNHYDGYVEEELLRELPESKKLKIYREMENNPIISGLLAAYSGVISQVKWRTDIGKGGSEEDAEFVESCRHDMSSSWQETISSIMPMLRDGFYYSEVIYKKRMGPLQKDTGKRSRYNDGKWGWRKFAGRASETISPGGWVIDDNGGIKGVIQKAPPDYIDVFIPIEKSLLFRTTSAKNNPEGRALIRGSYEPWYYFRNISKMEGIGVERDLCGVPVFRVPANVLKAGQGDLGTGPDALVYKKIYDTFKKMLTSFKRDEQDGVILSSEADDKGNFYYDFKLLASAGTRQFDTDKIVMRWGKLIALSVLADVLMMGLENIGSMAMAKEKGSWLLMMITGILDGIKDILNRHAIPRLLELNGMSLENPPTIEHGGCKNVDPRMFGDVMSKLQVAGFIEPDPKLNAYIRNILGLPAEEV